MTRSLRTFAVVAFLLLLATVPSAGAGRSAVPRFKHVLVVVFENKERSAIVGNPTAPTFTALARKYASMTAYDAVTHPSLPNFLALVSGSTQGITSDCTSCVVDAPNLAVELEHAGLTWKTYAEGLPAPGYTGAFAGRYAKKHDPFLYCAADRSLSLFSLVVRPGAMTPVHDHLAWGLVGLYKGNQDEEFYRPEGGRLELTRRRPLSPGDFYALLPPRNDVHRVRTTSAVTSVSIHLLANDTGCVLRHTYDEETGETRPFRSGYVNANCEEPITGRAAP